LPGVAGGTALGDVLPAERGGFFAGFARAPAAPTAAGAAAAAPAGGVFGEADLRGK
jgi:hypothetical protein